MAQGETNTSGEGRPPKKPYGPGMLIIFGIVCLIIGIYILYALYPGGEAETWTDEGKQWKIYFNWGAAVVAFLAAIYSFVLAGMRSKKGLPEPPAPAAPPPAPPGGGEARPSDPADDEAAPRPPESGD